MWKYFCNILGFLVLAGVVHGQEVVTDTDKRYSVEVPKGWTVEAGKDDIDLKLGQVTIHIYPASGKLTTLDAVMEDIVQFFSKQGIAAGPKQRLTFPGGEALWTEAPGTERPYLGAVSRGGKFFFVNAEDKAKNSTGILETFLAAVRSVRPLSSPVAATSPSSGSSAPPKAIAAPLASAKPSPWNLSDLQKQAKALSASDIPPLRARATGGDARSQFLLGLVYEFGHAGITKDLQQALSWFKQAAEQGIGLPQAWVGDFYYQGIGIPVNFAEAFRWYRKAAEQNYSWAQFMVGEMNTKGQGVPRDRAEAMRWYRKAADNGHNLSKFIAAIHYEPTGYETVTVGSGFQARGSGACKWTSVGRQWVHFETGRRWSDNSGNIGIGFSIEDKNYDPERLIRDPQLRGDYYDEPAVPQYRRLPDGTEVWWGTSWHMKSFLRFVGYARRSGTLYRANAGHSPGQESSVLDCFLAIVPTLGRVSVASQLTDPVYGDHIDFLGEWLNGDLNRSRGVFKSLGERSWIFAGRLNGYATDVDSAMTMMEAEVERRRAKLGTRQTLSMTGLQALWSEIPGSEVPFYGVVARGGRFYYVYMDKRGNRETKPEDQQGFLSALQSIRP